MPSRDRGVEDHYVKTLKSSALKNSLSPCYIHKFYQGDSIWMVAPQDWLINILAITWCRCERVNPLSPNSDQQQFSPNNIHTLSRDKVMRINKMIIIEKIPWSFIKFSQLILKGDVWRSIWRIYMWMLGLKGLRRFGYQMIITIKYCKIPKISPSMYKPPQI